MWGVNSGWLQGIVTKSIQQVSRTLPNYTVDERIQKRRLVRLTLSHPWCWISPIPGSAGFISSDERSHHHNIIVTSIIMTIMTITMFITMIIILADYGHPSCLLYPPWLLLGSCNLPFGRRGAMQPCTIPLLSRRHLSWREPDPCSSWTLLFGCSIVINQLAQLDHWRHWTPI